MQNNSRKYMLCNWPFIFQDVNQISNAFNNFCFRRFENIIGTICYVLTAFYILLYSRPGLSLLAVRDISITMKILLP